jgi:hypothetical protein
MSGMRRKARWGRSSVMDDHERSVADGIRVCSGGASTAPAAPGTRVCRRQRQRPRRHPWTAGAAKGGNGGRRQRGADRAGRTLGLGGSSRSCLSCAPIPDLQLPYAMDDGVPDEVRTELMQILSNLVLGDNDVRAK